jgi:BirA family biotin operon repressor/biotin-[acetyl-CoA-carboxylase] ligase
MVEEESSSTFSVNDLQTGFIGKKAIYYPRVSSTMDAARDEVRKGADAGTVVIAGEQTEGRGRMKRTWLSPKGNIAFSVILYPEVSYLPFLVMIAALAAARGIETVTGLDTSIKWPNDILISGKKAGGILIENEVKGKEVLYAIIGIGINTDVAPTWDDGKALPATCLKDESGKNVPRTQIIKQILEEMESLYLRLPDSDPISREWRDRMATLGKRVRVYANDKILEGVAETVDPSGSLLLRHADGSSSVIVAGDVTLRESEKE